jgi:hypothetical protein
MQIRFYYRPPCGLCREIEGPLLRYSAEFGAQVTHVNIDEDRTAHARYWDKIPVIEIDGGDTLYEPITAAALREAMMQAVGRKRD